MHDNFRIDKSLFSQKENISSLACYQSGASAYDLTSYARAQKEK